MFSSAQASVSLRPLPPIPMQAMFNLLLRFCPRKSAGTPNASPPAARQPVLINPRRSIRESEVFSADFSGSVFGVFDTRKSIHSLVPKCAACQSKKQEALGQAVAQAV